jgi:CheY-like chemotaxis protein
MKKWNVEVVVAKNGIDAVSSIKQNKFDVVLMDLHMPLMDGYCATQKIRSLGFTQEALPIIALTASVMGNEEVLARKSGMNDFMSKPFSPAELYIKLKRCLPQ